jgi:hypothetical protein
VTIALIFNLFVKNKKAITTMITKTIIGGIIKSEDLILPTYQYLIDLLIV